MKRTTLLLMLLAVPFLMGAGSKKVSTLEPAINGHPVIFCGELGANTDEFFAGPYAGFILGVADDGTLTNHTIGSATCNALGDTTVGNADASIGQAGYLVNGMYCVVSAAPGAATTVVTFVDDTANTAMTCSIGAAATYCTTDPGLAVSVAAASVVAVSSLNPTDDENAQDIHCQVYIAWQ